MSRESNPRTTIIKTANRMYFCDTPEKVKQVMDTAKDAKPSVTTIETRTIDSIVEGIPTLEVIDQYTLSK